MIRFLRTCAPTRIGEKRSKRLLIGQRIEQLLIFESSREQRGAFLFGQDPGGIAAEQGFGLSRAHRRTSQLPPRRSSSSWRHRKSHV